MLESKFLLFVVARSCCVCRDAYIVSKPCVLRTQKEAPVLDYLATDCLHMHAISQFAASS